MQRYLNKQIIEALKDKMVFMGGPRQVGKTTIALDILCGSATHPAYLNWDLASTKKHLLAGEIPADENLLIFDEIHKYKNWRNLIKGFYDIYKGQKSFLITGSARLDYYRRGGDSLQGRYHYYRLHPLSFYEISHLAERNDIEHLLEFGGFPEPFLKGNKRSWKRWQKERCSRVIQEDLLSLEYVKEVSQLNLLVQILPDRVGSILSINNLKNDLQVAFETVDRWIRILENIYYCFRISPYGLPALRTAKKEKKLYLWDWSLCCDQSAKFENMVASNLLKYCHFNEDYNGDEMTLSFIRDTQGREIDFVVCKKNKPIFAVECKIGESSLSKHISYFAKRSNIPLFYQVHLGTKDYEVPESRARIIPFVKFAEILGV